MDGPAGWGRPGWPLVWRHRRVVGPPGRLAGGKGPGRHASGGSWMGRPVGGGQDGRWSGGIGGWWGRPGGWRGVRGPGGTRAEAHGWAGRLGAARMAAGLAASAGGGAAREVGGG